MRTSLLFFLIATTLFSCTGNKQKPSPATSQEIMSDTIVEPLATKPILPDTIIDAAYTFEEAVAGSGAPEEIIRQQVLIDVFYRSTDGKIHQGQLVTHADIADDLSHLFEFMLKNDFVIEKAIPIVRYGWSDSLSMDDNNSYSFCYRDISYSKHARGMAVDINPRFNPLRWKHEDRPNQPEGAVLDTTVNGTLYPGHPVVDEFRRKGFRWGHTFSRYWDDHHFEKR